MFVRTQFCWHISELVEHLANNEEHYLSWSVLLSTSKWSRARKNWDTFFFAKLNPSPIKQEEVINVSTRRISISSSICGALTLLHGCFSRFLSCTNGTKSRNTSHCSSDSTLLLLTASSGFNVFVNATNSHSQNICDKP